MTLPVVLIQKNNQACILKGMDLDSGQAKVIFPEHDDTVSDISIKELTENYTGYAIFVKSQSQFEPRADEYHIKKPESWFWTTLWRFRSNYYRVAIATVMINILAIASPLFVMNVYDRVVPNNAFATLWVLAMGVTIAFVFDFILKNIRGYLIDISGKKADTILSAMLFQQVMGIRMEQKPASTGAFSNNLHGFESVRDFFTSATLASIIDFPFIFLFVWVISFIGGSIAFVSLLTVPIVIIVALFLEVPIRKAIKESFIGSTQKQAILIETLNTLENIKILGAQSEQQRRWEKFVSVTAKAAMKSRFFSQLTVNFSAFALQMVTVVTIVMGVYLISNGELSMGGLIACVILSGRTLAPLTQVASLVTRFQQSRLGLEAMNKIMTMEQERDEGAHYLKRDLSEGSIELNEVVFHYPNQQTSALNQLSMKVNSGEKIAILGRAGSGKSSLLKIIIGLYAPQTGRVLLDDADIKQLDPADVRKSIAYVPQNGNLFYGTLRDNIAKSAPWVNDAAILKAAQIAGVDQFAKLHPAGFDMLIGENGEGLSGGQRQSVIVARSLLLQPKIVLLDEPTNSMDTSLEEHFRKHLCQYVQDKTLLIVTHKLSMAAIADRIIVVDAGKIIADDSKEKIMAILQSGSSQDDSSSTN